MICEPIQSINELYAIVEKEAKIKFKMQLILYCQRVSKVVGNGNMAPLELQS